MSKKKIKIESVDEFTAKEFKVKIGETYEVQSEAKGERKYGYLINTKNGRAIVMYEDQVTVLEN